MIDSLLDLLTENQWWAILIVVLGLVVLPIWIVVWTKVRREDATCPWILPEVLTTFVSALALIGLWNLVNLVLWLWAN